MSSAIPPRARSMRPAFPERGARRRRRVWGNAFGALGLLMPALPAAGALGLLLPAMPAFAAPPTRGPAARPGQDPAAGPRASPGGTELTGDEGDTLAHNVCKKQPRGAKFKITLPKEAELNDLVNWMMSVSCQKFIWDPKVRGGKVTILSPEPVTIDEAYAANDDADWAHLAERFGAEFALVNARHTPRPPPGEPVVRVGDWSVYPLPTETR